MNENFYNEIVKRSSFGYFCCEPVKDDNGKIVDFIILDINDKFQEIIGLEEKDILKKSAMDIMSVSDNESFNWFDFLKRIILKKAGNTVERFMKPYNGWVKVQAFPHSQDYIIVQLMEVRKEELFTKVLIDSLPFTAWAKDREGRYITVNKKYEEDSGLVFEEIQGKNDQYIWPPNLAAIYMAEDNEVIMQKKMKIIDEFYFQEAWYKTYKSAVCDKDGNVVGTIGFSINIDEEKKIKKEIENQKNFLKLVYDSIPDFIFYKDINGRYLGVNNSLARMYFGKSEEEIIGKSDVELNLESNDVEKFIHEDKEVTNNRRINIYEKTIKLMDGTIRDYETIKAPYFDRNNNIIGILGISRDITQRRTDERKLKESEEKFRQLAENIEGVFFIKEGDKIIYVSPGYEKIFGRSCNSLYNDPESLLEAIHPEDRKRFVNINDMIMSSLEEKIFSKPNYKEYIDETFRIRRPDGIIRWIWFKGFPIKDDEGNEIRVVGIGEDITAIKEAERELDRIRTEFFANLSHEFRTPLNLIFSSLQMVELRLKSCSCENSPYINKYANIIKQNSFRLLRLVNNLIDSTKIDAGYVEYSPENHDIVEYVENIADSVASFAKEKGIELIFDTEIEQKIIAFDLDKIERIMLNLLSNSIKFNIPKGRIEVFLVSADKFVEIHVKDSGIGIPQDKLSSVFERFKQINNRLTKVSEGSGIGLSLVKSLVEMHGGTIEVKSELGRGTEFTVKLPDKTVEETDVKMNQFVYNSSVEKIQIEFSDIYGLNA